MAERPIIFSAPMVRAILAGRKTMTRRLAWRECTSAACPGVPCDHCSARPHLQRRLATFWQRARPGDQLWVRETWAVDAPLDQVRRENEDAIPPEMGHGPYYRATEVAPETLKWRSPIHMPRHASRITLEVAAARVERLQVISADDCRAEGHPIGPACYPQEVHDDAARDWFMDLWDSLHKPPHAWADNPEVVVLTFRRIEP